MTTSVDKMMAALNQKRAQNLNAFNRGVRKTAPSPIKGGTQMPGTGRGAKGGPAGTKVGPGYVGEKPLTKGKTRNTAGKAKLSVPKNTQAPPKSKATNTTAGNTKDGLHIHIHMNDNDGDEGGY